MKPNTHLLDSWVLRISIQFDIVYEDAEVSHLHSEIVHYLKILIIDSLKFWENVPHKEHRDNVYDHDQHAYSLFVHFYVYHRYYDIVILATNDQYKLVRRYILLNSIQTILIY